MPDDTPSATPVPEYIHQANKAKLEAETRKVEAEIAQANADADKAKAEARKLTAEATEAEAKATKAQIDLQREEHKRKKELASDEFHHNYVFDSQVSESSVKACIKQLADWERTATSSDPLTVELVINSPGGSIFDGFALIDYIEGMHRRGHTVNTTAYGMAASMGGVILQVGKERRMGANAAVLIHEASFGAQGSMGKIEDQVELGKMLQERILDLYAARAANSNAEKPMSRSTLKRRWFRKDWWINAQDCLRYGFVDAIV